MSTNTNKNNKAVVSKQKEILPDWFNEDLKTNSMDSKRKRRNGYIVIIILEKSR